LEALVALDHPAADYEVIVVDDGSGDQTPHVVGAFAGADREVRYLPQANSGVAKARNTGAAAATGELLLFLDDDLIVPADHIDRHLAIHNQYGACLVNGPWVFSPATRGALEQTPFGRFRIELEQWVKTAVDKQPMGDGRLRPSDISAQDLSIEAELFAQLGGFDEAFPFAGCEDQDFSHRAKLAGSAFIFDPALLYQHNDERVTLARFCGRQRRGAHTSVYLVARHPDAFADRPLLLENAPLTRYDPWRLRFKKLAKAIYASAPGLAAAAALTRCLEVVAPRSRLLDRLYTMTIGAHIYRGVREGLAQCPSVRVTAHRIMRERYGPA
jgi:GT2 family glycosyltransferase